MATQTRATASFRITLKSAPNPDHGETRAPKAALTVEGTLDEVLEAGRDYSLCIGGGNWHTANISRSDNGKWTTFARMSYNGRVWSPDGTQALYE